MKAKAVEAFVDREAGVTREAEEVFECTPERAKALEKVGYAVAVAEPKKTVKKAAK